MFGDTFSRNVDLSDGPVLLSITEAVNGACAATLLGCLRQQASRQWSSRYCDA